MTCGLTVSVLHLVEPKSVATEFAMKRRAGWPNRYALAGHKETLER